MKGNRHNVIRALGDFLSGVSRYDSRDDVDSAPEKVRRATAAKGPVHGPFRPSLVKTKVPEMKTLDKVKEVKAPLTPVKKKI